MATLVVRSDTRQARDELKRFGDEARKAGTSAETAGRRVGRLDRASSGLDRTLRRAVGAFIGFQAISRVTRDTLAFERALAEVATIADFSVDEMAALKTATLDLAVAQGQNEAIVARGLYQAISSGARTAGDAMTTLETAGRLATISQADLGDTVTVIARSLDAYADSGLTASEAADRLFGVVERGIVTVPVLAKQLGDVTTFAANAGVSFDELGAAIAVLSKGQDANKAITQLAQLFLAVRAPTTEAVVSLEKYGVELGETRVRSEGIIAVLNDLKDSFQGNDTELRKALGSQEALVALLRLSKDAGADFNTELDAIRQTTGSVGQAFDTFLANPGIRVERILNAIRIAGVRMTDRLLVRITDLGDQFGGAGTEAEKMEGVFLALEPLFHTLAALPFGVAAGLSGIALTARSAKAILLELAGVPPILGGVTQAQAAALREEAQAVENLRDTFFELVKSIGETNTTSERHREILSQLIERRAALNALNAEAVDGTTTVTAATEEFNLTLEAARATGQEFGAAVGSVAGNFATVEEAGNRAFTSIIQRIADAAAQALIFRQILAPIFGPAFGGQAAFLKLVGLSQGGVVGGGVGGPRDVAHAQFGIVVPRTRIPGGAGNGTDLEVAENGPELFAKITKLPTGEIGVKAIAPRGDGGGGLGAAQGAAILGSLGALIDQVEALASAIRPSATRRARQRPRVQGFGRSVRHEIRDIIDPTRRVV